jgi:uncharacterized NAD(P)/FAD-binding protein YdhS
MTEHPTSVAWRNMGAAKPGPHVVVIGGGASGVLMAAHLLSQRRCAFQVTVIEGRNALGRGLAYSTDDPHHLLNTRVHNMSAYPDDPHHFLDWLQARPEAMHVTDQCFVSRGIYGAYLSDLLAPFTRGPARNRLRVLHQMALRVEDDPGGVIVHLSDGQQVTGDLVVLATGHVLELPDPDSMVQAAWDPPEDLDRDGRVLILGSGLSMVDQVLSLLKAGHRGEILSVSRRGQLPRAHQPTKPLPLSQSDIPLGAPISLMMAWARDLARRAEQQGGTWRDAVDGIRPHLRSIWQALPPVERARFLRHGATWWDVHRHRLPPASEQALRQALTSGQLILQRGAFRGALRAPDAGPLARIWLPGQKTEVLVAAACILDCRGIRRDPEANASPLVADLLARGRARVDPLRIGLDVDETCRILDRTARPSPRLFAIGPVSRTAFWEITAIPDIRDQVATLAAELAITLSR